MEIFRRKKYVYLTVGEILFYAYWIVMCFIKAIGWYEGMASYNVGLVFSLLCICLKIFLEKHSAKELFLIAAVLGLGVVVYLYSGEKAPLIYIFLMTGMLHIPVKRVFRLGLMVWSLCFLYRALTGITGFSRGMALVHEKLGLGPILRWAFGYPHPNVMHITYAVLAAYILYLTEKRGKELVKLLLLLFAGNCYIFFYSVSYTGFLLTSLCLIIFYYFVTRKRIGMLERIGIICLFPVCVLFSVLGPILTGEGSLLEQFGPFLNRILNSRFNASRVYLWNGIHLFGCRPEAGNFALDCSYVYILVKDGLVFALLVGGIYFSLLCHCQKKEEWKKIALILSFLIAGISEPFLFNSSFKNLIFVFSGEFIYKILRSEQNKGNYPIGIGCADKKILVPIPALSIISKEFRNIFARKRKMIVSAGILSGFIVVAIYASIVPNADSILVGAGNTDCGKREEIYLERTALLDDFNGRVYEYQGPDSPLYEFKGNLVRFERIRELTGFWLIGSFVSVGVLLCILYVKKGKTDAI